MNDLITVLGATGFVGSELIKKLEKKGYKNLYIPKRDEDLSGKNLGKVIYCIGLTADFRYRLQDTVEAHVSKLLDILKNCSFEYFIYLSSTRVYQRSIETTENTLIRTDSQNTSDLYNISKIMGESLLLNTVKNSCVFRLSNVYGNDFKSENFLTSLIKEALETNQIILNTSLDSEKDYISIDSVTETIINFLEVKYTGLYNLASGKNKTNKEIVDKIKELTNCNIIVSNNAISIKFPEINIDKLLKTNVYKTEDLLENISHIINSFKEKETYFDKN